MDYFVNPSGIDFAIRTEIFLSDDNVSHLKVSNYTLAYKYRVDGYFGAAVLIKEGIVFRQMSHKSPNPTISNQTFLSRSFVMKSKIILPKASKM